jgi:hypothetical protein
MPPVRIDPYPAFNFLVEISGFAKGSFTEVWGLDSPTRQCSARHWCDHLARLNSAIPSWSGNSKGAGHASTRVPT